MRQHGYNNRPKSGNMDTPNNPNGDMDIPIKPNQETWTRQSTRPCSSAYHVVDQLLEAVTAPHEVRLAVHLHDHTKVGPGVDVSAHRTLIAGAYTRALLGLT